MEGQNALVAINLKSANNFCEMRFWYWFSNVNVGSINIFYRKVVGENLETILSLQSVQMTSWERASIRIPITTIPIQVNLDKIKIKITDIIYFVIR